MFGRRDEVSVLLIEDDDIDVMAVKRAFRAAHIENPLRVARNGEEGLAMLRGDGEEKLERPYIILLDLNMPKMDGIEFLEELRGDEEHRDAVVFVLTTSKAPSDRAASYAKNVAGYIVKSDIGDGFVRLADLIENFASVVVLPS